MFLSRAGNAFDSRPERILNSFFAVVFVGALNSRLRMNFCLCSS